MTLVAKSLALAAGLLVSIAAPAPAAQEDLNAFDKRVGRHGRNSDRPKALCLCLDAGTLQHRVGYLTRGTVDNGQTARIRLWCSVPLFAVSGPYVGGDNCQSFQVMGR